MSELTLDEIRTRSIDLVPVADGILATATGNTFMGQVIDGTLVELQVPLGKQFIVYQIIAGMNGAAVNTDVLTIWTGHGVVAADGDNSMKMKVNVGKSDVMPQTVLQADPRVGLFSVKPTTADEDDQICCVAEAANQNLSMRGYMDDA